MPQRVVQYGASRAQTAGYQLMIRPCTLYRIDGYCTGSANSFLQLFDAKAAPATNDIPKKSLLVVNTNGYSYTFLKEDMVSFVNGVYLALSTNETKFVADASGTKVSGDITLEDSLYITGETVSGNLTTPNTAFQIWNNAISGFNAMFIVELVAISLLVSPRYVMFFASDSASNGDEAFLTIPLATNDSLSLSFGDAGLIPQQTIANVAKKGLYIALSNSATEYNSSTDTFACRVTYKTGQ